MKTLLLLLVFSTSLYSAPMGDFLSCEIGYKLIDIKKSKVVSENSDYESLPLQIERTSEQKKPSVKEFDKNLVFTLSIHQKNESENSSLYVTVDGGDSEANFDVSFKTNQLKEVYFEADNIYMDGNLLSFDIECQD